MKTKLIPEEKIIDQRFGQLLYNAMIEYYGGVELGVDGGLAEKLFYIENNTFQEIIDKYLEENSS